MLIKSNIEEFFSIISSLDNEFFLIFNVKNDYGVEELSKTLESISYLSDKLEPEVYLFKCSYEKMVNITKIEIEERSCCVRILDSKITDLFYIDEINDIIS